RRRSWPGAASSRRGRYEQVNAYGPRWADLFEEALPGTEVSRFGHGPLNEAAGLRADREGPLVWLPGRRGTGIAGPSDLEAFAGQVTSLAAEVPVLLKPHPLAARHGRSAAVLRRLAAARNVTVAPPAESPYRLLEGCRGVLAPAGSLALEASCAGLPVALARPAGTRLEGLQAELAARAPAFAPGDRGLAEWAQAPPPPTDTAWARDLLFAPDPRRNDAFAARLRERAAGGRA
ncbi:MAG TPA: hypothetical protein VHI93_02980, partial [Candidatus Thermoplasmatota archaeon]|nr:hypothetical protein [Candidatus Thermoplasmatota archaeon]